MKFALVKEKSFYRALLAVALPIILQNLITVGVNVMDTVMLSKLGEAQISGSSLANQYIMVYQTCCMGLGVGASVMTARFWGARQIDNLKQSVTIMLRLTFLIAALFTLSILCAPETIMRIYTNEEDIIREGTIYFMWSLPAFFMVGGSLTITQILRSIDKAKIALYSSIGAFFVNVFFNYVFIFGKFGAPRMEIAGAALGTVLARVFEFCFICSYFFLRDKQVGYRIKDIFRSCKAMWQPYITISMPVLISDMLLALGTSAVSVIIGHVSAAFVAANAICAVVARIVNVVTQGLGASACVVIGQSLGQGDREKIQSQGNTLLLISLVFGVLSGIALLILKEPMIWYYQLSEETAAVCREMMNALSILVVIQSMDFLLTKGVLRAGGDTKFLMVFDILFLWVASIPLGALAGLVLHLSAFWTFFFLRIDRFFKLAICLPRLYSGKWIKKITQEV